MAPTFRVTSQAKAKVHARFASALHHLDDLGREPGWREALPWVPWHPTTAG